MISRGIRHPILTVRRRQVLPEWVRRLDARAGRRINARRSHPVLDRSLVLLSTAANHGVLWFSIAGLLVVVGKPRAAVRGALSLVTASALANLVGKQLFGGDRPLLKDVPLPRQLYRTPTSGSFPSGHSASAAAFATGVALESPGVGAALAPLAAGVAYSRLHTGAHWPSDVIGGIAIGAGVALAGRALIPGRTAAASLEPTGRPVRRGLPTDPDGRGLFVIVNPSSGGGDDADATAELLSQRMPAARIHVLTPGEDLDAVVGRAIRWPRRGHALGVCGGDGTVACVAQHALRRSLPLLVLPGGTLNHFATAAGIPDVGSAIGAYLAGTGRDVDVAELTPGTGKPVTVLNTASVGIYPEFVRLREHGQGRLGKPVAALVAAFDVLPDAEPFDLEIAGRRMEAWSVFVGVDRYLPDDAAPLRRAGTADELLDVRVLRAGTPSKTRGAITLALGTAANAVSRRTPLGSGADAVESFATREIVFSARTRSGADPGYAHDGETHAHTPGGSTDGRHEWRVRMLPGALTVYAPATASASIRP